MRKRSRFIGCVVFGSLFSFVTIAQAQPARTPEPRAERDQSVVFDDDLLAADLATPFGDPVFSGHLRPGRALLIRPRTSFVPELYESVEQI